jgi:Na+/proline symporter
MMARYTFAEGSGKVIHNRAGAAPDLYIPRAFRLLHQPFLTPPWREFTFDRPYAIDVAINIAGFVPFGLILCAYLSWQRRWSRAAILTILAGAAISLTIEVLQSFLPSRFSGVTDLITNTLGTALGVALFRWGPIQNLVSKLRPRSAPPAQTST